MARAGVTYVDIAKAAEAIKSRGQEPTVDRVREQMGTGSKSTIAPLLKRWRSDNGDAADISGLPNDLVEVVKSLHERVQQMADHKINQARSEFKAITEELRQELAEAGNTIAQLTSRQHDLEQQLDTAMEEKRSLSQSLEDARVATAKSESQRDEAVSRVTEFKVAIEELKQENRDIRDHFEHYQQRTAEDRQQEREQFRATNRQLEGQIEGLTKQLTQAEAQISEQNQERTQHQAIIDKQTEENHTLQQEVALKNTEIVGLSDNFKTLQAKNQYLTSQNEALQEKVTSLTGRQSAADKEVILLTQSLEKAEAELRNAKDKIALLADENKIILQEKAVIQGQFKQLQDSI